MNDKLTPDAAALTLANRLKHEREERGWSLADLAARSGVSKAMISKIERCEVSPTAALLGRLSGAFNLTLSALLSNIEDSERRLATERDQPLWRDPQTGYLRRTVSPSSNAIVQLTLIDLPAGAEVMYPAAAYAFIDQQVWVLDGELTVREGEVKHLLSKGDCLQLGEPADCLFRNATDHTCQYLVAVGKR